MPFRKTNEPLDILRTPSPRVPLKALRFQNSNWDYILRHTRNISHTSFNSLNVSFYILIQILLLPTNQHVWSSLMDIKPPSSSSKLAKNSFLRQMWQVEPVSNTHLDASKWQPDCVIESEKREESESLPSDFTILACDCDSFDLLSFKQSLFQCPFSLQKAHWSFSNLWLPIMGFQLDFCWFSLFQFGLLPLVTNTSVDVPLVTPCLSSLIQGS